MSETEEESAIEKELHAMFESEDSFDEDRLSKYVRAEKDKVLGFLVSSVAHDSNNFVAAVLGMAEMGKMRAEESGDAENASCYGNILDSAEKLSDLIKNLLNFSKRGDFTRGTVYINDLLESVVKLYKSQYIHDGIDLVADLSDDVPAIDGYPAGLETVFVNMAQNAMHAYEGMHKERPKTVHIRSYHKEGYIFVEFEDDGCGIKKEDLGKIFDAWYTTKGKKGHGIGLAIANMTVQKSHLGKILVESECGKGTKFTIKIPDAQSVKTMREETYFGQKRKPNSET